MTDLSWQEWRHEWSSSWNPGWSRPWWLLSRLRFLLADRRLVRRERLAAAAQASLDEHEAEAAEHAARRAQTQALLDQARASQARVAALLEAERQVEAARERRRQGEEAFERAQRELKLTKEQEAMLRAGVGARANLRVSGTLYAADQMPQPWFASSATPAYEGRSPTWVDGRPTENWASPQDSFDVDQVNAAITAGCVIERLMTEQEWELFEPRSRVGESLRLPRGYWQITSVKVTRMGPLVRWVASGHYS